MYIFFLPYSTGEIQIRRIPKLTTGRIQPLDKYGFRPMKNFFRKISDLISLLQVEVTLRLRDNIIKLQSLAYNQMCSPRYQEMFKYGWYSAGYLRVHPECFQTPVEYSFPPSLGECDTETCGEPAFLRCGWCSKDLCFKEFFVNYHLCEEFNQ